MLTQPAVIPRTQILGVDVSHDNSAKQPGLLNATLLTTPNVLITFAKPITVSGPYGITRTVTQLTLFVDERATFINQFGGKH